MSMPMPMGCKINSLNSPTLLEVHPSARSHLACFASHGTGVGSTDGQVNASRPAAPLKVEFRTLEACKLGIARYPDFTYNAMGGTGSGRGSLKMGDAEPGDEHEILVTFDLDTLYIPPLSSETTRFLGLPLPPFLKIDIIPEFFGGRINQETGQVELELLAKFCFAVGSIYKAPPLIVKTVLTSEESRGSMRSGRGERVNEQGRCRLVGVATVVPINDLIMDSFLGLPTECLADLNALISCSTST